MSCCQLPPPFPLYEYQKKCLRVNTTNGSTYCEIFASNSVTLQQPLQSLPDETEVLLMIHGLGGSCFHWSKSDIPSLLAQNNVVVICFDLYSHGKSSTLNDKETPHSLDTYLQQVYDVVHSKDLPLHNKKHFNLLGFSFGGFLTLNYVVKYHKTPSCPCCSVKHAIPKIIFQSPWHGYLPGCFRGIISIPGVGPLFRPADMAYINDYPALRRILCHIDKEKKFKNTINELVELIENYDKLAEQQPEQQNLKADGVSASASLSTASPDSATHLDSSSPVDSESKPAEEADGSRTIISSFAFEKDQADDSICSDKIVFDRTSETASQILFLCGNIEGYFSSIAKSIRTNILKKHQNYKHLSEKKKKNANSVNQSEQTEVDFDRRFPWKLCKWADHMTFVHRTNRSVGEFYRETIAEFIVPKLSIELTDENIINPHHSPAKSSTPIPPSPTKK
jgi:pimeloyl-ACP methyl ester carboxylesterase